MGRKRARGVIELSSSPSDSDSMEDIQCTQADYMDSDPHDDVSDTQALSDDDSASYNSSSDDNAYEKCLKNLEKIKILKKNLEKAMRHKSKKKKSVRKSKEGFTRFSARAFTKVISSLTKDQKDVITKYGFGSLMLFDNCYVPNSFAKWAARLVDSKSGDIIHDGKIISLTEETVHLVLDLPIGSRPFPSDPTVGRDVVLSKFGKTKLPPVVFFADKIINHEVLSDEDLVICFLVVALSSFLCSNTNTLPSPKYFGIFEDIDHIKEFKWCAYVLQWLLEHIKAFNRSADHRAKRCLGLGGCLYFLAVVYLDHVDFSHRQPAQSIPRISVWKGDLIHTYSELDMQTVGVYGYRPKLEFEKTCYFKSGRLKSISCDEDLDHVFFRRLEDVTGCKLPLGLKLKISQLIEKHSFDHGLSFNVDVLSLSNVSKEFQTMLGKLLNHVCNLDLKAKQLVVDVFEAISSDWPIEEDDGLPAGDEDGLGANASSRSREARIDLSTPEQSKGGFSGSVSKGLSSRPVANRDYIDVDKVEKSKSRNSVGSAHGSKVKKSVGIIAEPSFVNASVRSTLADKTNVGSHHGGHPRGFGSDEDVIFIDKENFAPDSVSPSQYDHRRKKAFSKVRQHAPIIPIDSPPHITPNLASKPSIFSGIQSSIRKSNGSSSKANDNSPVVCIGSVSLADKVRRQTEKMDEMYNKNLSKATVRFESPFSLSKTHGFPVDSSTAPDFGGSYSDGKTRIPSSGGKVPLHGVRRMVRPSRILGDEFEIPRKQFKVTKSEVSNYKAVIGLSASQSSSDNALYFGPNPKGVRCTFWSLGESLKPGGEVNNFLVAAFCYHLYCRPDGDPDASKRHYFFPNISDILLKDHAQVHGTSMKKAFDRSGSTRPLHRSDLLFFPSLYMDHWFVFVVDIKDHKWVFLDCMYSEDDDYHLFVRGKMIPEFIYWWDQFVKYEFSFDDFETIYPPVPKLQPQNDVDSGIYAMMCMEYWSSPRTSLMSVFDSSDIPVLRIKFCNDMMFNPRNTGRKELVMSYKIDDEF